MIEKQSLQYSSSRKADSNASMIGFSAKKAKQTRFIAFSQFQLSFHDIESKCDSQIDEFSFVLHQQESTSSLRMSKTCRLGSAINYSTSPFGPIQTYSISNPCSLVFSFSQWSAALSLITFNSYKRSAKLFPSNFFSSIELSDCANCRQKYPQTKARAPTITGTGLSTTKKGKTKLKLRFLNPRYIVVFPSENSLLISNFQFFVIFLQNYTLSPIYLQQGLQNTPKLVWFFSPNI